MSYRLRNMLIAVALAGLAALLVTYYVSNYKNSVQKSEASVPVLVAAKDIPVGTTGADVAKGYLKTVDIARKAVVPGAISSATQIRGLVALQPVYAGEQVTTHRFGPLTLTGVKGQLTGTYRAVQLAGDTNQVLAGTVEAGDHVDFEGVVSVHSNNSSDVTFSRIVVRNIEVLQTQAGSTSAKIGSGDSNNLSSIMLRLSDAQTQKVGLVYACARSGGSCFWTLALRPALKSADSPNSVETAWTLLKDGISNATLQAAFAIKSAGGN